MSHTRLPRTSRRLTTAWEFVSREGFEQHYKDWSITETAVIGFKNYWKGRILRVWAGDYLLWENGVATTDVPLEVTNDEGRPVIACKDFPLSRFGGRWPEFAAEIEVPE